MNLVDFSPKQMKVLSWWKHPTYKHNNGVIADGSIRSGKTLSMTLSFLLWSMATFNDCKFAICGQTIHSVNKNIVKDFLSFCEMMRFRVKYNRSQNRMLVSDDTTSNEYFIYGGSTEQSQDLIQGMTLAGVMFDEVALLKESFVNQATGRCSITGSKYWFNCNPATPTHYFKENWINRKKEKKLLYLHFTMDDNLSLDEEVRERYKNMYTGAFFDRYILGHWVAGQGAIYDMFDKRHIIEDDDLPLNGGTQYITVDYGTKNPFAMLRVMITYENKQRCVWVLDEYYYDGRKKMKQKTDAEYAIDLLEFFSKEEFDRPHEIIIDPSAASFKAELKNKVIVRDADNSVLDGIRLVASLLNTDRLKIHSRCTNLINEFYSYQWKDNKSDKEEPIKENDHALDALRYFCKTIIKK